MMHQIHYKYTAMESLSKINQETRIAYNKAAQKYFDLFKDELEHKEFDKKYIDNYLKNFNQDSLICDAGCGPCGHITKYISNKGFRIIGIDISESCIEIAKKQNPDIQFETGDFAKLNFSDNYFDGLISYYSIIDTPKIYLTEILKEFNRVLKKNGHLLLVVKEGESEGFENELIGIKTKIYFSLFTMDEIKGYLNNGGFGDIQIEKREPYKDEIKINRIYSISKKIC